MAFSTKLSLTQCFLAAEEANYSSPSLWGLRRQQKWFPIASYHSQSEPKGPFWELMGKLWVYRRNPHSQTSA